MDVIEIILEVLNKDDADIFLILYKISTLNEDARKSVLENEQIRNILGIKILKYSSGDFYRGFDEVLSYLKPSELLSLYDVKTLKEFFSSEYKHHEYKLYASCMNKNENDTIAYVLKNDELFKRFFSMNDYFYSCFHNIDYPLFKEIINKLEQLGFPYRTDFLNCVSEDNIRTIIQDNISNETLVLLLKNRSNRKGLLSDFFKNDFRAKFLFDRFNIISLIDDGVEFSIDILRDKKFFELIKGKSFIEFRETVNKLERNNEVNIIEKRVSEYHNEILSSYDRESGLFKQYIEYLEHPEKVERKQFDYVYDGNIWMILRQHLEYRDDKYSYYDFEGLKNELIKETGKRLSEVIVDALFQDNIYNVWLNIKEMLRYNEKLEEKIITPEWENFYRTILNIDDLTNNEKLEMYNKFKGTNINIKFYDDLRKLKDI